jgi:hypothetical protein
LGDDESNVIILQLNLTEEFYQLLLGNCALPITFLRQCCKDVLVVVGDELGNLDKEFLLFLLGE